MKCVFLPPPRRPCFRCSFFFCLFVTKLIFTKLGGGVEQGPRKNPFNLGVDSDQGLDPGTDFSLSFTLHLKKLLICWPWRTIGLVIRSLQSMVSKLDHQYPYEIQDGQP